MRSRAVSARRPAWQRGEMGVGLGCGLWVAVAGGRRRGRRSKRRECGVHRIVGGGDRG